MGDEPESGAASGDDVSADDAPEASGAGDDSTGASPDSDGSADAGSDRESDRDEGTDPDARSGAEADPDSDSEPGSEKGADPDAPPEIDPEVERAAADLLAEFGEGDGSNESDGGGDDPSAAGDAADPTDDGQSPDVDLEVERAAARLVSELVPDGKGTDDEAGADEAGADEKDDDEKDDGSEAVTGATDEPDSDADEDDANGDDDEDDANGDDDEDDANGDDDEDDANGDDEKSDGSDDTEESDGSDDGDDADSDEARSVTEDLDEEEAAALEREYTPEEAEEEFGRETVVGPEPPETADRPEPDEEPPEDWVPPEERGPPPGHGSGEEYHRDDAESPIADEADDGPEGEDESAGDGDGDGDVAGESGGAEADAADASSFGDAPDESADASSAEEGASASSAEDPPMLEPESEPELESDDESLDAEGGVEEGVTDSDEVAAEADERDDEGLLGKGPESDKEMPLADHIEEMVQRVAVVLIIGLAVTLAVFGLGETVTIINHLWEHLIPSPGDNRPRLYGPLELLLTQLKVAGLAGLVVGLPVFVYETYLFMRPGLYSKERKYYLAAVPTSLVLAVIGVAFAYLLVLPGIFAYFTTYTQDAAVIAYGLRETFNLILIMMGYMAIVFQIPLFVMLAIMMNVVTRQWMEDKRLLFWGAFLGLSFTFVAVDPTGMAPIIIAITMVVLFEGTLALLRWTGN